MTEPSQCVCYGGDNPLCEVHHPRSVADPAPPLHHPSVDMKILAHPKPVDLDLYNRYAERLRELKDAIADEDGYAPDALILVSICPDGRVFSPILFAGRGVESVLPPVLRIIAMEIEKKSVQ